MFVSDYSQDRNISTSLVNIQTRNPTEIYAVDFALFHADKTTSVGKLVRTKYASCTPNTLFPLYFAVLKEVNIFEVKRQHLCS
jgi:hypothetical protein